MKPQPYLFVGPFTGAGLLACRLQKPRIRRNAVIMNVLPIRHIRYLRVAAYTESPSRALLDEGHFDFLPRQVWLAEPRAKQLGWNRLVLLANLYLNAIILTMNHAALSPRL